MKQRTTGKRICQNCHGRPIRAENLTRHTSRETGNNLRYSNNGSDILNFFYTKEFFFYYLLFVVFLMTFHRKTQTVDEDLCREPIGIC